MLQGHKTVYYNKIGCSSYYWCPEQERQARHQLHISRSSSCKHETWWTFYTAILALLDTVYIIKHSDNAGPLLDLHDLPVINANLPEAANIRAEISATNGMLSIPMQAKSYFIIFYSFRLILVLTLPKMHILYLHSFSPKWHKNLLLLSNLF